MIMIESVIIDHKEAVANTVGKVKVCACIFCLLLFSSSFEKMREETHKEVS
jgi:hypothetical protein